WPPTPRALSGRLRRAAATLRKTGTEIRFVREGHARVRTITIVQIKQGNDRPHRPHRPQSQDFNGLAADANAYGRDDQTATVRTNSLKNKAADDADGRDAKFRTQTGKAKPRSDDLAYDGPVVPVPDLGPDLLDEHGAPTATNGGGEPGLSRRRI